MNPKISVFICVEAIIYLSLYNLHDTHNLFEQFILVKYYVILHHDFKKVRLPILYLIHVFFSWIFLLIRRCLYETQNEISFCHE